MMEYRYEPKQVHLSNIYSDSDEEDGEAPILEEVQNLEVHSRDLRKDIIKETINYLVDFGQKEPHAEILQKAASVALQGLPTKKRHRNTVKTKSTHSLGSLEPPGSTATHAQHLSNRIEEYFLDDTTTSCPCLWDVALKLGEEPTRHEMDEWLLSYNDALESAHESVLHVLVRSYPERVDICELLLHRGADPNAVDLIGQTPAFVAADRGYLQLLGLLIEFGADLSICDNATDEEMDIYSEFEFLSGDDLVALKGFMKPMSVFDRLQSFGNTDGLRYLHKLANIPILLDCENHLGDNVKISFDPSTSFGSYGVYFHILENGNFLNSSDYYWSVKPEMIRESLYLGVIETRMTWSVPRTVFQNENKGFCCVFELRHNTSEFIKGISKRVQIFKS